MSQLYSIPFIIRGSITVKAVVVHVNYLTSVVVSADFLAKLGTPELTIPSGQLATHFGFSQPISFTCETPDVIFHYTTDGSLPIISSPSASESTISLYDLGKRSSCTVMVLAVKAGYGDSAIGSLLFTQAQVETPVIDPKWGMFPAGLRTITLDCDTFGATIYYTSNGSDPAVESVDRRVYGDPFDITIGSTPVVVKAIGMKAGFSDSQVVEGSFQAGIVEISVNASKNDPVYPDTVLKRGYPILVRFRMLSFVCG